MKRLLLLVVACALLVPPVAHARDWRTGFGAQVQAQGQPMKKAPGRFQPGDRGRQGGYDKGNQGNQGRLTQEERQKLHRDLDRANREIYRR